MNKKDWNGNKKTTFTTLGASNHSDKDRETNDYYATDPIALELLLKLEQFNNVWECACGEGHLSKVLIKNNIHLKSSDLIDRGFGESGIDFISIDNQFWNGDIITNPPFRYAQEFAEKALQIIRDGDKLALFLRIQFLESIDRKHFFKSHPPKTIYVSSKRIKCAINGKFNPKESSAACYIWVVWEKGYSGETILKWFN